MDVGIGCWRWVGGKQEYKSVKILFVNSIRD